MKLISRLMVAAIFSALLAGDSIAQQTDDNRSRRVASATGTTGAAPIAANGSSSESNKASEPSERERLLQERIGKLEQLHRGPETIERVDQIEKLERRLAESQTAKDAAGGSPEANRFSAISSATGDEGDAPGQSETRAAAPNSTDTGQKAASSKPSWHYGGFVDVGTEMNRVRDFAERCCKRQIGGRSVGRIAAEDHDGRCRAAHFRN